MRCLSTSTALFLVLFGLAPFANAAPSTAPQTAQPSAAKSAPPTSAIIPGSPLAVLTGAETGKPSEEGNTPSPFGTETLGLSITGLISHETAGTVSEFVSAVEKSTTLTPVAAWLRTFPSDPARQMHAIQILQGLVLTVLPAWLLEIGLRFGLKRPRQVLVQRAARLRQALVASGAEEPEAEDDSSEPPQRYRRGMIVAWLKRAGLGILYFVLCIAPVLAFGVAAGMLLGLGIVASRQAHLAVVGLANAYLACRTVMEALRFAVQPWAPPLRLVRMPDARAVAFNRGARLLLTTGGVSYALVSGCEILGLPHDGVMALTRLLVLVLHIELAVIIWQSRKVVGRWIAGKPNSDGLIAGPRQVLGRIWHYLALFYVLSLWVAWAGGVQNAFWVLLRVIMFLLGALAFGRMAWRGSELLLDRIFPDPNERKLRHPALVARARAYRPLIRTLLRILIGLATLVLVLFGCGLNLLAWAQRNPLSRLLITAMIAIIATLTVALIVWEIVVAYLDREVERLSAAGKTRQALRLRTVAPIIKAAIGTAIGLISALICLSRIGVNAAPLLAGAGVLGIAIGFGSQKLVQDIITGLFLLMEDTIQVGDVVTLGGMSGTVERLSIRTLRLRGGDGSVNIIPFSAVTTVTNQTRDFGYAQISVGIGYHEDVDRVFALLTDIARTMRSEPTWASMMRDDLQLNGLDEFGSNALIITGQIRTGPGQHWAVRREFSRRVVIRFAEEKIEIPYNSSTSTLTFEREQWQDLLQQMAAHKPQEASQKQPGAAQTSPPAQASG